jgi:hypothetical protein
MDRPTIFLSSTVHDFADLRSALKDYLELRGCRILASEFTDFTRPLDKNSYDACLATIEQADLFVLFIGRRVGGWFDEPSKISITRAEYRHAYELAKEGRIRLLCFVRSDVWDHRQSARDLASALKADKALSDEQRRRLVNHPALAMENAEAIISFIDEVTKNSETILASKGLGTAPIANWISPFATFTQVRQALDPLIAHGLSVREAAGRKALETQLCGLLRHVVPLIGGRPGNPCNSVLSLLTTFNLRGDQLTQNIPVDQNTWKKLVSLLIYSSNAEADPTPLLTAISSDLLLRYDPASGTYHHTEEYDLLANVIDQARLFGKTGRLDVAEMTKYQHAAGTRQVPAHLIMAWMYRLLRWVDLIGSARALARSLGGGALVKPPMIPQTSIIDQEAMLKEEAVSLDQVRKYVEEWEAPITDSKALGTTAQPASLNPRSKQALPSSPSPAPHGPQRATPRTRRRGRSPS